jgi:hypothetical protein
MEGEKTRQHFYYLGRRRWAHYQVSHTPSGRVTVAGPVIIESQQPTTTTVNDCPLIDEKPESHKAQKKHQGLTGEPVPGPHPHPHLRVEQPGYVRVIQPTKAKIKSRGVVDRLP